MAGGGGGRGPLKKGTRNASAAAAIARGPLKKSTRNAPAAAAIALRFSPTGTAASRKRHRRVELAAPDVL